MKILFLHLSDLHLDNTGDIDDSCIREMGNALSVDSIGKVDKVFVFVTGDIAFSGKKSQYRLFGELKNKIIGQIKARLLDNTLIHIYVVPGNHDICYPDHELNRDSCESVINNYSEASVIADIKPFLAYENAFLAFSSYQHSLSWKNPLFMRNVIDVGGFTIEINLINSTVFSLCHENDQGLHFLPNSIISKLIAPSGADMAITLMHHSHQWFNDKCKPVLEQALLEKNTMLFFGHEHYQASQAISYNGVQPAQVFCGGSLCNRGDWTSSKFYACIFDTDTFNCVNYDFSWNGEEKIYIKKLVVNTKLRPKPSTGIPAIAGKFMDSVLMESRVGINGNLQDYYVFPGVSKELLRREDKPEEILEISRFISLFNEVKHVEIIGSDTSGKSAFLKALFNQYKSHKYVLLCRIEDISSGNRRRIIKTIFESIYGESPETYQKFEQASSDDKIILIDDLHLVDPKKVDTFLAGIEEEFGYVLYTTSTTIKLDIKERIRAAISKDSYTCYRLLPLRMDKRKELVEKYVAVKYPSYSPQMCKEVEERVLHTLELQRRYVPLTPEIIIRFIDNYSNYQMESIQNDTSIFGKVFEASITNALLPNVSGSLTVDKAFVILGKIAFFIHKNKKYPIVEEDVFSVVQNYCQEYGTSISSVEFISSALKSRILSRCSDNGLKFCNNNYLAYFIAYEICISEDKEALENCLKCSCFGINANILIFVSYITNKLSLIEYLLNTANQLIISGKEFAFGMDELSYLSGYKSEALDSLLPPTEEDIEKDHQASIEKDKNELESANIDVISIYDYDEEELTKIENQIIRSISLMSLIARCLPIFEHRLKKTEKERLVETLYRLPNTIFFNWADEVEKHYSELISLISNLESNEFTRHKLSIEEASQLLRWNSISLLLELYYLVANYAYRENTYEYLTDMAQSTFPFENETHYIEYLIILGQAKRIGQFITIGKQLKDSTKHPMAQLALIRTVQHIMLKGAVNRKQLDQLKSIFFPGVRAKDVLISRKAEERKEPNDHK